MVGREGSVAPKERVNIKYKPGTGGAREEIELPLKLLVMGDFTMAPDDRPLEERERININKSNFDKVLKEHGISISMEVPDRLSDDAEEGSTMKVELDIEELNDFDPARIAEKVPELAKLLRVRESLAQLRGPLRNFPEFRKRIKAIVDDDAAVEQILAAIQSEDEAETEEKGE